MVGVGALFPAIVSSEQFLSVPLPLSELVATPLLNRLSHVDTAAGSFRLRRQLDIAGDFMSERDVLNLSRPSFRTIDVNVRYHLGKVGIEGGVGSYRLENIAIPIRTGNLLNRYYVRVSREFKIF